MTCKECKHFCDASIGGICLGWTDKQEASASDSADDCPRAERWDNIPQYTPNIIEEYSEYDRIF